MARYNKVASCKTRAIKIAKNEMYQTHNCERLTEITIDKTSAFCVCGETNAVLIWAKIKGKYQQSERVGICKNCGND